MEENFLNVGEQPQNSVVQTVATENEGTTNLQGSPLGKFKNSESLLSAYNELQSEFTRKCQKLSETEKKLDEQSQILNTGMKKGDLSEEFAWNNKISDFLKSHSNANNFVEDITTEIMNDEMLKNNPEGLEKAYLRVLEKKFISQDELAKNPEFLDKFIYSNNEIKNKIINEYVSSLNEIKNPITINNSGVTGSIASTHKFKTLEEASRYVENMFKF